MQIPFPLGLTRLWQAALEAVSSAAFVLLQFATRKMLQMSKNVAGYFDGIFDEIRGFYS